nr:hypothetical protein [Yersinia pestis]
MNHRPDIVMRAEDISMRFPGTLALDSVNYTVYRGKVNATRKVMFFILR